MKKIDNIFSKQMLINYVLIFYLISILLDLHIFYNSISTLIRVIFISGLFGIIYVKYSNRYEKKLLGVYFIILLFYIVLHILNCLNFDINISTSFNILRELLYFVKMSMNIIFIYVIYKLNINKDKFYKIISLSAFVISFSIVISNIFKISYTAYEFVPVEYNIFDWYKIENIYFYTASSKGFFHLTNQISAILVLYLPILLVYLKEKINIYKILNIIVVIISLFMLSTRVSTYSTFIVIIISFIIYICTSIIDKQIDYKYPLLLILFVLISFGLYQNCPLLSRNMYYSELFHPEVKEVEINEKANSIGISNLTNDEFRLYLKNFNIVPDFYNNHYPLEVDRDFYENYISLGTTKINDTRFLELNIVKRVKELNNNKMDNIFGIGYDRVINIFNIENDFIMQYHTLGIIGLILILGVNVGLLLYIFFKILFNLERYFNFENMMIFFGISYVLLSCYYTGNILNSISCIIPISFVLGFFISRIKSFDKKEDYEYYLGFKTSLMNKKDIINNIFKEDNQVIIYNINPLICLNFRNNSIVKKEFNLGKYNIPDGNGIVLASKLKSNNIKESIPGIEVMEDLCKNSIKNNYSIYLYGSKEDSLIKCKKELEKKYKKINIIGVSNGYVYEKDALKDIVKKKPDILFVALGSPKQEEFIINNKKRLKDIKIIMPVGGSFDVIGGNLKRAPKVFRKIKMEWLYRMIKEPKRFKQIFKLVYFILLVLFGNFWYNEKENEV